MRDDTTENDDTTRTNHGARNAAGRTHDTADARREADDPRAVSGATTCDAEPLADSRRITVPPDSGIVGGGAPGDSVDIGTASGPSDSGGG